MGFSVSGAAAIVFAGMLLSFGVFYAATANSFERVSEAERGETDRIVDSRNTAIDITLVERDDTTERLTVHVNNTGAEGLTVNGTDFLVDNDYATGWQGNATVNGDGETDLWLPGERLNITIRQSATPSRVKLATERGVADAAGVP
jgi:flagellar protein FlaF